MYWVIPGARAQVSALKERIESVNHLPLRRKEPTSVSFVEVVPPGPAHFSECTVEIEDRDGTKMKVHLKSSEAPDLAAISSTDKPAL